MCKSAMHAFGRDGAPLPWEALPLWPRLPCAIGDSSEAASSRRPYLRGSLLAATSRSTADHSAFLAARSMHRRQSDTTTLSGLHAAFLMSPHKDRIAFAPELHRHSSMPCCAVDRKEHGCNEGQFLTANMSQQADGLLYDLLLIREEYSLQDDY